MNSGAPFEYDYSNVYNSAVQPSTVHCKNTALVRYFVRYLLQRIMSVLKWEMPERWAENYFKYVLFCWGFLVTLNTDKYGVIPQAAGLAGRDVFYRPREAIVTNPLLKGPKHLLIGEQCTMFRLQPDYGGVMDIVNLYADLMALTVETTGVTLVNSKLAYVFGATNKAGAESFKKMYDQIASGEPAVVVDKKLMGEDGEIKNWASFTQNVGQNYIVPALLSDLCKLEQMFDATIGLPNANTDKRERLISDEVNANNVSTMTTMDMWLDELKQCCDAHNEMFPGEENYVNVDWRVKPDEIKEEGETDESDDVDPGAV